MALLAKARVDIFIENTFNFPTLAEAYRVAALDIAAQRCRWRQVTQQPPAAVAATGS
jgi:NAD(P) transhydrogenase